MTIETATKALGQRKVTIAELLDTLLQAKDIAADSRTYPGNGNSFLVSGNLIYHETKPYQVTCKAPGWNEPFSIFEISGVVEQSGRVLAFRYQPKGMMCIRPHESVDYHQWKDDQMNSDFAEYLHLMSVLNYKKAQIYRSEIILEEKPRITLEGSILNSSSRLFLPTGIYVEKGPMNARNGFIGIPDQSSPLPR